jgi:parvulin-like peptidyl-prolyl isomerase
MLVLLRIFLLLPAILAAGMLPGCSSGPPTAKNAGTVTAPLPQVDTEKPGSAVAPTPAAPKAPAISTATGDNSGLPTAAMRHYRGLAKANDPTTPTETPKPTSPAKPPAADSATPAAAPASKPGELLPEAPAILSLPENSKTADQLRSLTSTEAGAQLKIINAVVAEVNNDTITREDLLRGLRPQMALWPAKYTPTEFRNRVRQELLQRLRLEISRRLLLQEAGKDLKDEQRDAIEKEVEKDRQRQIAEFDGSMAKWKDHLVAEGWTPEDWHKDQVEGVTVASYLNSKFDPKVAVTRQELTAYYDSVRAARYELPAQAHLFLIKLQPQDYGNDFDAMMTRANALIRRARAGENFATLAKEASTDATAAKGGDWGVLRKGSFREDAVDQALFSLPVGSISDALVCGRNIYIIKVADRNAARIVPFTEAQDEITAEVSRLKRGKMVGDYVNGLYQKAYIRIHEENL